MNFHAKPFDAATVAKLSLFGDYTRDWLPVFLRQSNARITVVDFFAGPGQDSTGAPGSPLVLLREFRKYTSLISQSAAHLDLILNEARPRKAQSLKLLMDAQDVPESLCSWDVLSLEFPEAFAEVLPRLKASSNLLLLDQQGVKFISDEIFQQLVSLPKTDFIFFIASSSLRRFGEHPSFQKYLGIPPGRISATRFHDTHREVTSYYRQLLGDRAYYLIPFSIKKGSNLYGLIFGTSSYLGAEKFLDLCWKVDPERGEANFDIDNDKIDPNTLHLFPEMDQAKKVTAFEHRLSGCLADGQIKTDAEVYIRCLNEGMLPRHGREVVKRMIRAGRIRLADGRQPRVSKLGFRDPRVLEVVS